MLERIRETGSFYDRYLITVSQRHKSLETAKSAFIAELPPTERQKASQAINETDSKRYE